MAEDDRPDQTVTAVAEQVDRLRMVVEELVATQAALRADDASADRWQARLSSLETRLSMAESTFQAEASRVESAVRSVEALGASLRGALEGAETVAAAGRGLDDRIGRLDAALAAGPDRERKVASALDSLTGQLNQFTTTLAGEIRRAGTESADASRDRLDDAVRAITDAATVVNEAADVTPRIDLAIAGVTELRQELAAVASRIDPAARLEELGEATARIDARLGQTTAAVAQQVRDLLADRLATGDPTPALEAMRADLRNAVRAIGEDRSADDEVTAAIAALAGDLAGLSNRVEALRARAEANATDLAGFAEVPTTLAKLAADLEPLATLPASLDGLGGAVEGAVTLHRRSAEAVETLQQSIDAARAEVAGATAATQHVTEQLDDAATAATEANKAALETVLAQQRDIEATRLAAVERQEGIRVAEQDRRLKDLAVAVEAAIARLHETTDAHAAGQDERLALLAVGIETTTVALAELAARPEPPAPLTREQLDEALTALTTELTDGPALPTVDDLNAAVTRIEAKLAAVPPPMSTADLDAAIAGIRVALASIPEPIPVEEIAAAVRVTLPELPATRADVEGVVARVLTAVDARLAGNVVEELRAEVNRVVEFRAEMLTAVADLKKRSPSAAATGDDVQAAAEGIAGAVRDAVAGAVADVRGDLVLVHRAVDGLHALRALLDRPETSDQLDAIGRLVQHSLSSLHLIEQSTVGVSSETAKARAEITAALADLDAARRARAASSLS